MNRPGKRLSEPALLPEEIIADPAASDWLKLALQSALTRDPVDALNDALALAGILEERLRELLQLDLAD
jgi:hypothetical protein